MPATKNKFTKQLELGHKDIRGKRAKMFATTAEEESNEYIRNLEGQGRKLEMKLMNLEDFHVDHTTSLKVTKDGFDSAVWVKEINETKLAKVLLDQKINVAKGIHNEYFN